MMWITKFCQIADSSVAESSTGHVLADRVGVVAVGRGRTDGRIRTRLLDRLAETTWRHRLLEARSHDQWCNIAGRRGN